MGWEAKERGTSEAGSQGNCPTLLRSRGLLHMQSAGRPLSSVADKQPHLQKDLLCHAQAKASKHSRESINHLSSKQQLLHFQISPVYPIICTASLSVAGSEPGRQMLLAFH